MRRLRPPPVMAEHDLGCAIGALHLARDHAIAADCPALAGAIRRALKSADGARRHLDRRIREART